MTRATVQFRSDCPRNPEAEPHVCRALRLVIPFRLADEFPFRRQDSVRKRPEIVDRDVASRDGM